MPSAIGFDNEKYLREQSAAIMERVARADNKLYLEFGGKLLFDYHAARVLPGYDPNVKMRLLQKLKDKAEILLCIHAGAIERKKMDVDSFAPRLSFFFDFHIDFFEEIAKVRAARRIWAPGPPRSCRSTLTPPTTRSPRPTRAALRKSSRSTPPTLATSG